MRFHSGLVSCFALISTALAYSVSHSQPLPRAEETTYDKFQAGGGLSNARDTFYVITATLATPWMTGGPGSGLNIFVALDGERCNDVSLRVGVQGRINEDGTQGYTPYYRWYPREMETFENITVTSGDVVTLTVMAMDPYAASVHIMNEQGEFDDAYLTSPTPLCRVDALWMVEPLYDAIDYTFYRLSYFNSIIFKDAFVIHDGGDFIFPSDSSLILNIVENKQDVTIVGIEQGSLTVSHL